MAKQYKSVDTQLTAKKIICNSCQTISVHTKSGITPVSPKKNILIQTMARKTHEPHKQMCNEISTASATQTFHVYMKQTTRDKYVRCHPTTSNTTTQVSAAPLAADSNKHSDTDCRKFSGLDTYVSFSIIHKYLTAK